MDRILAGDPRAFEVLVRRRERRVFRVTLAILGNTEDAEEAMQDAFLKAFRHLAQFRRCARWDAEETMKMKMDCREVTANMSCYIDGNGSEERRAALREHAPACRRCQVVFDTAGQMLGIVRDAEPFEVPLAVSARPYNRLEKIFSET